MGGEGRKQNRKEEKLGCKEVTVKAAADAQGKPKLGWPCGVTQAEAKGLHTPAPTSH